MTKSVLRCATLGTFLMALIAAPSSTLAFAIGAVGGVGGVGSSPDSLLRLDPPSPAPSSHLRRSGIKATHKVKKTSKESGIRRPGL